MRKDVIYIDIEDDITAVIEKLKNSSEKIIALVPPKGNAVLQSVVNLKLLKRAAATAKKQPVIVTSNHALTVLAGGLGLYVAKNLQSKPYLPTVAEAEESLAEDAVEVSQPIGEMEAPKAEADEMELTSDDLANLKVNEGEETDETEAVATPKKKKAKKVPNFEGFRKKLLLLGGLIVVLLIVGLFIFGRSKAQISVRAETSPVDVEFEAKIDENLTETNAIKYQLKAEKQESKKTTSQAFTPTGKKNIGNKASGSVTLTTCVASFSPPASVPAGTTVTSGGNQYITKQAATFQTDSIGSGCINYETNTVNITATTGGKAANVTNATFSVSGRSGVSGTGSASGGTDKMVTVISQADVDKATQQLKAKGSNEVKDELKKAFSEEMRALEETFTTETGEVTSEPAVGEEASEGRLSVEATYTMLGIKNDELSDAMNAFILTKMDNKDQQRVYDNGFEKVLLERVSSDASKAVYKVSALGQYGPQFDIENLKQQVAGKKYGEIRSTLQDLPGVKSVDIKLTPFWVRKAPAAGRINISLDVDNTSLSE